MSIGWISGVLNLFSHPFSNGFLKFFLILHRQTSLELSKHTFTTISPEYSPKFAPAPISPQNQLASFPDNFLKSLSPKPCQTSQELLRPLATLFLQRFLPLASGTHCRNSPTVRPSISPSLLSGPPPFQVSLMLLSGQSFSC